MSATRQLRPRLRRNVRLNLPMLFDVPLRPARVVEYFGNHLLVDFGEGFYRCLPVVVFKNMPIRKATLKLAA